MKRPKPARYLVPGVLAFLTAAISPALGDWQTGPLTRSSDARGNVLTDSSLEAGGWTASDGATITGDAARTGQLGARIQRADDRTKPRIQSGLIPVQPGRWLISGWIRTQMPSSADPNYSAVLDVQWLDAAGADLGSGRAAAVNGHTHDWVYRSAPLNAPAGAAHARLTFFFNWSSTGTADLDDVAMTPATDDASASPPVSLSLSAAERVFDPGAPLAVRASVRLSEGPPRTVPLFLEVTDSRGRPITRGETICEARSDRDTPVTITAEPAEAPIREHLVARVRAGGQSAPSFGLLVVPRPTDFRLDETSPFALLEGHPYLQRRLGARWQRPNFNWNEREMELAKRYGVTYVGMINEANRALVGDMPLEEYGQYVFESVSKFRHLVKYWQLGNEPNLYQPGIPERWAEVLRVGYEAAKRADPDCQVMWGGITGLNVDPEMVDKLLTAGGGKYTDIIDLHLYVPIPEMDRLLSKVRADMARHGVDKPIVITEVTAALGTVLPERVKASHVYKRYGVAEAHGVLASWWFVLHWVNTGEFRYCSLIDPGTGEPHEGAAAYARLTEAIQDARFLKRHDAGEGNWVLEWERGDRRVFLAWAEGEGTTGSVSLPCGQGDGTVVDVAGHEWSVRVGGNFCINLRDEPLLLDLPAPDASIGIGPGIDVNPAELRLPRGAAGTATIPGVSGTLNLDAPAGIEAGFEANSIRVRALPDAELDTHWLVLRETEGPRDAGFYRLAVTVTPPLQVEITPLPVVNGPAAVNLSVTNLGPETVSGSIELRSPVSGGLRRDEISIPFQTLGPGRTGTVTAELTGRPDPLARYPFQVSAVAETGVREVLERTLVFTPAPQVRQAVSVDGDLSDWPELFPIVIGANTGETSHPSDGPPSGPGDISARAALQWDESSLYLAAEVTDDLHANTQDAGAIWDGDGIQFGLAPWPYAPGSDYYEWGVALTGAGLKRWSWRAVAPAPTGNIDFPCAIKREEGRTLYEMAIPWAKLPPMSPQVGITFGFGLLVNEMDTGSRGYYGWHQGIAGEKDRARFGQVTLVPAAR
ncbi:MAG: hypothetical protein HPY44_17250 [Armatimonadetes bacterium]|nr:hypothetical protein [Armatimonadota bacterium]